MDKIKVLFKEPYKDCELKEVSNSDLKEIRNLINCRTVQAISLSSLRNVAILLDEDGKIKDEKLPGNFFIPEYEDCVVGNCVFVQVNKDGDFTSLNQKQINQIKKYTKFFGLNEGEDLYGEDRLYLIARAIERYKRWNNEDEL